MYVGKIAITKSVMLVLVDGGHQRRLKGKSVQEWSARSSYTKILIIIFLFFSVTQHVP